MKYNREVEEESPRTQDRFVYLSVCVFVCYIVSEVGGDFEKALSMEEVTT